MNNGFEEQGSSYNEKSYSTRGKRNKSSMRDELKTFTENKGNIGGDDGLSKNTIIIIGVVVVLVILGIVLLMILMSGGNTSVPAGDRPKRYEDPIVVTSSEGGFPADVVEELRRAGYTGTEIEQFELNGDDPDKVIELSRLEREKTLVEEYSFMVNKVSDQELLKFIKNTIYTNPPAKDPAIEKNEYGEYVLGPPEGLQENADYWKVPLRGHQAYLKLKLKSGEIVFYEVGVDRYKTLRPSGNIVVNYYKHKIGDQTFISNIREIEAETPGLN